MRHHLFLPILLTSNLTVSAQNVSLVNPWQKNSAFLYIGVQNVLQLKGPQASVVSLAGEESSVRRTGDSVIVTVIRPGSIKITASHQDGTSQSFWFEGKHLPPLQLQFVNTAGIPRNKLKKEDFNSGYTLKTTPGERSLYNDYSIIAFSISIGGDTFYSSSDILSTQTIPALENLQPGNQFSVNEVSLHNKTTGNKISAVVNVHYEAL